MTDALVPPRRKDPLRKTREPLLPQAARSRIAHGLTAAAAEGRFALQVCSDCGAVAYPPRDLPRTPAAAGLPSSPPPPPSTRARLASDSALLSR